ncbi:MAG: 50S ribosomal protein L9 [Treponema sp.]|jgi:large subunit ribosomal protein L9|nr:50S ribosomal protein L9 [Treponema sp.]
MKVILNKDLAPLGEEGDVKDVAKGYARNYLFPRGIALPYTDKTVRIFEARRDEIEARKAVKRQGAAGLKETLEALSLVITMPAGANGKLYGAVTSQTIMEELAKQGFQVERKRIELPGNSFKSVGKYKVTVKLYENAQAECTITVEGQAIKAETPAAPARGRRRRPEEFPGEPQSSPPADTGGAGAESPEPPAVSAEPEVPEEAAGQPEPAAREEAAGPEEDSGDPGEAGSDSE